MTNMEWKHEGRRGHAEAPQSAGELLGVPPMKRAPNPAVPASIDAAPEFERGHVDTPPSDEALFLSRRGLLGAMAATFAVVGAEGCRRPVEKVVPYTRMPEDVIPGVPSHYATVIQRRGDALGLVVESHEGRPTKIEGNETHPSSFGGADLIAQASILELYDPERSTTPRKGGIAASWDDFEKELGAKLATFDKDQGARLRLLMPPTVSPTVLRMRAALAQRFPKARVHTWSAVADSNARVGREDRLRRAGQHPVRVRQGRRHRLARQRLPPDRIGQRPRQQALRRRASPALREGLDEPSLRGRAGAHDDGQRRGPSPSPPGERHRRLRLRARGRAREERRSSGGRAGRGSRGGGGRERPCQVADGAGQGAGSQNRGRALVVVGSRQPPEVHALAHAHQRRPRALRDRRVTYAPVADPDELDVATDLKALTRRHRGRSGRGARSFSAATRCTTRRPTSASPRSSRKVPTTVHASLFFDETSEKCTWHVPRAHEYESWGDAQALDGTVRVQQPLIAPLYAGRSDIELLGRGWPMHAGEERPRGRPRDRARRCCSVAHGVTAAARSTRAGDAECKDATGSAAHPHQFELDREWNRSLGAGRHAPAAAVPRRRLWRRPAIAAAIAARKAAGPRCGGLRGHVRPVRQARRRSLREQHVAAGAARRGHEARLGQRRHPLAGEREGARRREQGLREDHARATARSPPPCGSSPVRPTTRSR